MGWFSKKKEKPVEESISTEEMQAVAAASAVADVVKETSETHDATPAKSDDTQLSREQVQELTEELDKLASMESLLEGYADEEIKTEFEESLELLRTWLDTHFPVNPSDESEQSAPDTDAASRVPVTKERFHTYYSNQSKNKQIIQLNTIPVPQEEEPGFFEKTIGWLFSSSQDLADTFFAFYNRIHQEIQNYLDNWERILSEGDYFRYDTIISKIEHAFSDRIRLLTNELNYSRINELSRFAYYKDKTTRFDKIISEMAELNRNMSDYMLKISNMGHADKAQDLEDIRQYMEQLGNDDVSTLDSAETETKPE